DVTVLPYRSGTQSGVTHVAYALGTPVIATRVGGLTESIRDGDTGLTVPPEDPPALAAAIVRFFAEGLGERMRGPIASLRASHSWDALAALLTYALTGGGRIVGSDEVTMFELARSIVHGSIKVPEGATMRGPDGQTYTKNTWGEAL